MSEAPNNPMEILEALESEVLEDDESGSEDVEVDIEGSGNTDERAVEEGSGESSGDESSEEVVEEPAALILGKFKTQEDLEKAYKEAERKMHDEARQRREYELYLQGLHQSQQQQPQGNFQIGEPQSVNDLIELSYDDPDRAVAFAAEHAPHLMNKVISTVRQFDPEAAEEYHIWYSDYKMDMRLNQMQEPIQQMQAKTVAQQAFANIAARPEYQLLREDIAEIVKSRPHWFNVGNPEQLAIALNDAYEMALAKNSGKISAQRNAVQQKRELDASQGSQGVERGSHAQSDFDTGEEDPLVAMKNSIIEVARLGS